MGLTGFLTLIAVVFFLRQFFRKKGNFYHIGRGYLILIITLAVVIINTVSIPKLVWDLPFIIHTSFGLAFFWLLSLTIITGIRTHKEPNPDNRRIHGLFARFTGIFLTLSILAIGLIWFTR